MMPETIHQYVKEQEAAFESDEIQLGTNWYWNFKKHVQLIFHLKNGQFYTGANDFMRAFKNIMEPMLELANWTEDIDVKDVVFFIEGDEGRALSFLVKKYHDEKYVRQHDLDVMLDEITESDNDYGGVLVQRGKDQPEVMQFNAVAFCDQTDIMGGPLGLKFNFSPSKLRGMASKGWGDPANGATISIEDLCILASAEKDADGTLNKKTNKVPGKSVEVYIVRGDLPESYLMDGGDEDYYCPQVQVVAFYTDPKGKVQHAILYRKKQEESDLLFFTSKKVHGRALGRGTAERLLHPQVWTNFATIHKNAMLEAASKVVLYTDDESYTAKNKIQDMENLEITKVSEGRQIAQVPTAGVNNIALYENSINEWYAQAQLAGAAQDPLLGKEESSGTTFRGQERLVAQGRGSHDKRRGQRAKFIELIYRTWIIPKIVSEITKGQTFLATLSPDELTWVSDQLATNYANTKIKRAIIEGKPMSSEEQDVLKQTFKESFAKTGNKQLIKILKDEFKDIEIGIGINVAGKQKDLAMLSDKLLSIFQFVFANPAGFQQAMQIPALAKSFADIMEFSGLSQADFLTLANAPVQATAPAQPAQPMQLNAPAEA